MSASFKLCTSTSGAERYVVTLTGSTYDAAAMAASNMWCNSKTGNYGSGCIQNPSLAGRLGEYAVGYLLGADPDSTYRKYGDETDLRWGKLTLDVKTNVTSPVGLVRASHHGHTIPLKSDRYVFCRLWKHNPTSKLAKVVVLGWLSCHEVAAAPLKPGKYPEWVNYTISYESLRPMSELLATRDFETTLKPEPEAQAEAPVKEPVDTTDSHEADSRDADKREQVIAQRPH